MSRKYSAILAATAAALSLAALAPAKATDSATSAYETGPVTSHHDLAPTERVSDARGRTAAVQDTRSYRFESRGYEVQTPSSVNESEPYVSGGQNVPTVPAR